MSPPAENALVSEDASQTIAAKRISQSQTTRSACHHLALARANALSLVTVATANGTIEATPEVLDATAGLAASLYVDLWVSAEEEGAP